MLARSVAGISATSGDGSKRQRVDGKFGSRVAYGPGQAGASGLRVLPDSATGFGMKMLPGNVLPDVVSFTLSGAMWMPEAANLRWAPNSAPSFWYEPVTRMLY